MLNILLAKFQQYMNWELPDVQAGFRRGRGTWDQIANIHWIIEKAKEFQKNICFIDYAKAFDSLETILMLGKIEGKRRGQQRMRWLDSITKSMHTNLRKLQETDNNTFMAESEELKSFLMWKRRVKKLA